MRLYVWTLTQLEWCSYKEQIIKYKCHDREREEWAIQNKEGMCTYALLVSGKIPQKNVNTLILNFWSSEHNLSL